MSAVTYSSNTAATGSTATPTAAQPLLLLTMAGERRSQQPSSPSPPPPTDAAPASDDTSAVQLLRQASTLILKDVVMQGEQRTVIRSFDARDLASCHRPTDCCGGATAGLESVWTDADTDRPLMQFLRDSNKKFVMPFSGTHRLTIYSPPGLRVGRVKMNTRWITKSVHQLLDVYGDTVATFRHERFLLRSPVTTFMTAEPSHDGHGVGSSDSCRVICRLKHKRGHVLIQFIGQCDLPTRVLIIAAALVYLRSDQRSRRAHAESRQELMKRGTHEQNAIYS